MALIPTRLHEELDVKLFNSFWSIFGGLTLTLSKVAFIISLESTESKAKKFLLCRKISKNQKHCYILGVRVIVDGNKPGDKCSNSG